MKLRTKIMIICCVVLVLSIVAADFTLLAVSRKMTLDEVNSDGYVESVKVFGEFELFVKRIGTLDDDTLEYYMKSAKDDYTVLFRVQNDKVTEIHNNTIFSYADFMDGYFDEIAENISQRNFSYKEKRLSVYRYNANGVLLFHIYDKTYDFQRLNTMTWTVILVSATVLAVALLVLYLNVKRSMKPLGTLVRSAKDISAGDYGRRIDINTSDELGLLSEEFNKMAESVEVRERKLEAENERRWLFMGNLTHELKTPLTAISGYAQTMCHVKLSDDEREEALSYIHSECMRLERLSKKMMKLLEFENGLEVQIEKVSVNDLFEKVEMACAYFAAEHKVFIDTRPTEVVIETDFDLMTDVLINLTDNAIKASNSEASVKLYAEEVMGGAVITVEDFGCGIPENEKEKILEPFYTVDKSRCRKNGGSGLGLSLAALIINKLGIRLEIESEVGVGTKMRIYI